MPTKEEEALQERLKSALWYAIGKMVDEETLSMGVNATPQFIGALTEMVWAHLENVSHDLEAFAQHASRKTITTDDVLLLTRRNEGLETVIRSYLDEIRGADADEDDGDEDEDEDDAPPPKAQRRAGKTNANAAAKGKGKGKAVRR